MDIKPIRNDEDYEIALQQIDQLWDVESGTPDEDKLDILCDLVEAYERRAGYELPCPEPIAAIEYYMESRGISRQDMEPLIGSPERVREILNRQRPLTLTMIRRLAKEMDIPASILILPYEIELESQTETAQKKLERV